MHVNEARNKLMKMILETMENYIGWCIRWENDHRLMFGTLEKIELEEEPQSIPVGEVE